MPDSLARTLVATWHEALLDLAVPSGPRAVLVGTDIEPEIECFAMMDGPPLAGSRAGVAVFGADWGDIDLTNASPGALPVPDGSVDLVVALHAWTVPGDLDEVAIEAARVVKPGGGVVFGELDIDRLINSTPRQHLSSLLYTSRRDLVDRLRRVCVERLEIEVELIRLSLNPVRSIPFDRATGVYETPESLRTAIAAGKWRMTSDMEPQERERLAALAASLAGPYPYVETEPWHLVAGSKPPNG